MKQRDEQAIDLETILDENPGKLTPEKLSKLNLDDLGFRERADAFRYRCKLARVSHPKTPIVREDIGRPKGKTALRAAKRERVRAMKLQQSIG